jgi:hypothetical protein
MRPAGLIPVTALLAVLAAAAPGAPAASGGETSPLRLTIAFTGDVSGYLEPCG